MLRDQAMKIRILAKSIAQQVGLGRRYRIRLALIDRKPLNELQNGIGLRASVWISMPTYFALSILVAPSAWRSTLKTYLKGGALS